MSVVVRGGKEVWVEWEEPGDRYLTKPIGGPVHRHEFVEWIDKSDRDGLPLSRDRCVSGYCERRR